LRPSCIGFLVFLFSNSNLDILESRCLIIFDISSSFSSATNAFEVDAWFSSLTFLFSLPSLSSYAFNLYDTRRFDSTSIAASCLDVRLHGFVALNHSANLESKALANVIMVVVSGGLTSKGIL
jgi:hypothetical protein